MERASSRAFEVGEAGDVNGDGRVDVLVGAYGDDNNAHVNLGSAYVAVAYGLGGPAPLCGFVVHFQAFFPPYPLNPFTVDHEVLLA